MPNPSKPRPDNREVENENLRPDPAGKGPPRPATEPPGAGASSRSPKLQTDPGSGEPQDGASQKT